MQVSVNHEFMIWCPCWLYNHGVPVGMGSELVCHGARVGIGSDPSGYHPLGGADVPFGGNYVYPTL